ncbi:hypothetical protein Hanom_Chr09g00789931 [Helianthus anomalus]
MLRSVATTRARCFPKSLLITLIPNRPHPIPSHHHRRTTHPPTTHRHTVGCGVCNVNCMVFGGIMAGRSMQINQFSETTLHFRHLISFFAEIVVVRYILQVFRV